MSTQVLAIVPTLGPLSSARIAHACEDFGVRLSFPQDFLPSRDSGLIPCLLNGQVASFEFLCEEPLHAESAHVLSFEARSSYASFTACAFVAASSALLTGGYVRDDDGNEFKGEALREWLASVETPTEEASAGYLRISATVVGPRGNNLLQLKLGRVPAGVHLARRLVESVPLEQVPARLRAPNSRLIIVVRDACEIVGVEPDPPRRTEA